MESLLAQGKYKDVIIDSWQYSSDRQSIMSGMKRISEPCCVGTRIMALEVRYTQETNRLLICPGINYFRITSLRSTRQET